MQRSAWCRSRRELSNAYLLAKFRFDTAENEPSKSLPDRADLFSGSPAPAAGAAGGPRRLRAAGLPASGREGAGEGREGGLRSEVNNFE